MDDKLSLQVAKLGHELEEIRVRALTSIISKLDLGIIKENDLINKYDIFVKLLDWFNFPNASCKKDVLLLISRLARERDGAFYLQIVDPELNNLKKTVGTEFRKEIKEITELIQSAQDDDTFRERLGPQGGSQRALLSGEESLLSSENALSLSATPSNRSKEWLYTEIYWPVPRLDESDLRVLTTVGKLLCDQSQCSQAANFFSTVLLHDFPPQVFLRDTSILNALFTLFEEGGNHQYVLSCFKEFTLSLHRQFKFYEDPASIEKVCHVSNEGEETALCEWTDPEIEGLTEQLGVGEYCALSLEKLGGVVPGVLHLLKLCIKDPQSFWESTSGSFLKSCISNHLTALASRIKTSRLNDPLVHLETQVWVSQVLLSLIPISVSSSVVNQILQITLAEELYDPCLMLIYPQLHEIFKNYVSTFQYLENNNYEEVQRLAVSLKAEAKFMLEGENLEIFEALSCFQEGLMSMDIHHEITTIKIFFKIVIERCLLPSEAELSEKILLSLMSHMETDVQEEVYLELSLVINKVLGPPAAINSNKADFEKIRFLLNPTVLKEIVNFGVTNPSSKVSKHAESILTLILKAKLLLSSESWTSLLSSIATCFPLLQGFASDYNPLGKCVLQMFDPDVAADLCLHPLQVISGNTRFLFSPDHSVVSEGYSRLIYLLGISPDTTFSMPDIPLLISSPTVPFTAFSEDNIPRLIEVLKTTDGKMLKSAVIQVSLISEQPSLHVPLLDAGALPLLFSILNSSIECVTECTQDFYSSIILVFKNLALHNIQLRNDFSTNHDLYANVLKGLFTLLPERRWMTDAVQLLALMVFSDFIETADGMLSFPKIITDNFRLPFHAQMHSVFSKHTIPSKKNLLSGRSEVCQFLGALWCCSLAGGPVKFVAEFNELHPPPHPLLLPPKKSFILLTHELEKSLIDLKVASSHEAASRALALIYRYIKLIRWSNDSAYLASLPWEQSFKRYLMTIPASPADQLLLIEILRVLDRLIGIFPEQVEWVSKFVSDPSNMLSTLLTQTTVEDCTSLKKELSLELLALVEKCIKKGEKHNWEKVAVILLQSLHHSHTQKFYSLAVVDKLLGCVVCLAGGIPVPGSESPLWKLLSAFHCPSKTSFMGLTITRRALFALNSIIVASKDVKVPEEAIWISKLLSSRDSLVVGAALELSSHLSKTQNNLSRLLNFVPDLWELTVRTLIDHRQSSLVREQAAFLCCNIVNNSQNKTYINDSIEKGVFECFAIIFSRFNTKIKPEDIFTYHLSSYTDDVEKSDNSDISSKKLITYICCLTTTLMLKDRSKILTAAEDSGFIPSLARAVSTWQCEKISDYESVEMYESVLRTLVYAYSGSSAGPYISDSIQTLIWLLLPSTYEENLIFTGLMTESLRLLSLAMTTPPHPEIVIPGEAIGSICSAVISQNNSLLAAAASAITVLAPFLTQGACVELIQVMGCRENMRPPLASIVGNSHSATLIALDMGILNDCISRLRTLQLALALAPRNSKKATTALEELNIELGLLTNFLAGCSPAKEQAASLGLADSLHKLWLWTVTDFNLLSSMLRALITFTANSSVAAGTLVLTSTLAGVGQRKNPTSSSLLHAILSSIMKEVFTPWIKVLFLEVLLHASQAPECRNVIAKSNFLLEFLNVHDQKKSAQIDELESMWVEFLCVLTNYTDGQACVIKNGEVVEKLLDYMCGNRGTKHKAPALRVIRNLIFNQANRQRFILSEKVLGSVSDRLTDIKLTDEELRDIVLIAWTLSANSQKGKGSVRATGLAVRIESALHLQPRPDSLHQLIDVVLPIIYS